MGCWMFNFLQNSFNVSDVKFLIASEIAFVGNPNLANISLVACT